MVGTSRVCALKKKEEIQGTIIHLCKPTLDAGTCQAHLPEPVGTPMAKQSNLKASLKSRTCPNAPIMYFQSLLPLDPGKSVGDGDSVSLVSPALQLHDDLLWSIFRWNANMAQDSSHEMN